MAIIKKMLVLLLLLFPIAGLLMVTRTPQVTKLLTHPLEVKTAVTNYQQISHSLFNSPGLSEITLDVTDLHAISQTGAHIVPNLATRVQMQDNVLTLNATLNLSHLVDNTYINASCTFTERIHKPLLESCQVGRLYLPSSLVINSLSALLTLFEQDNLNDIFLQLMNQSTLTSNQLTLRIIKDDNLKQAIKQDARQIVSHFKLFSPKQRVRIDSDILIDYLHQFSSDPRLFGRGDISLALVFNRAFAHAAHRSKHSHATTENMHALFAVALTFASRGFETMLDADNEQKRARINNILGLQSFKLARIHTRHDLALHFLYSAVIEQLSNEDIAFNVGELKELFDANRGGSQYDLSDLVAGVAGARFAKFISQDEHSAQHAQKMLATNFFEDIFMPNLAQYPQKMDMATLEQQRQSSNDQYTKIINNIYQDVAALRLYGF